DYPASCEGKLGNSWCVEIDLDVEMVSAACPNCTIYLVEANSYWPNKNAGSSLAAAEREAVKLGAHIVSNSWACSRCWPEKTFEKAFETPDVVYLAAAGDDNSSSAEPARFPNVVSVGGTFLSKKGTSYREIVWPWTGGGSCAKGITKPSWQHDPGCKYRTQNDVAAVAQNVAVYDSYDYSGWIEAAGTSVASPLIAGVYALAGNASSQHGGEGLWTLTRQQRKRYLHVISEGANGRCGGSYLCTAGTGQYFTYSGPAGWGTPNGIGAF
ncbi:MAG: S8 family serine peptidase, partial [Candidatus Cybelea sp.]